MARAYIGIGANLGDAQTHVREAIVELGKLSRTQLLAASSLYRTKPVGHIDQPDFINAVAATETALDPHELLASLRKIEQQYSRVRTFRNAPRTLDLDVLLYDEAQFSDEMLTVPHPRMHERAFVLAPLAEIAPGARIPGRGEVHELLLECADQRIEKL
jgi:2-amino-4-hydroxy-6-hydroxymethyldihydropteridine diphosphokinase